MPAGFYFGKKTDAREAWRQVLSDPPKRVAIDTETVSLKDRSLIGLGIATAPSEGFYFTPDTEQFHEALRFLRDDSTQKIYHNAPYDLHVLREYGISTANLEDTAMMGRLMPPKQYVNFPTGTLVDMAYWVGIEAYGAGEVMNKHGAKGRMTNLPVEIVAEKCYTDTRITYQIFDFLKDKIDWSYYRVDRDLLPILDHMSGTGIRIDQKRRAELDVMYTRDVTYYRNVCETLGFNPASPQQVAYMLGKRGSFMPLTKSKKQLSTDEKVLFKLTDPLAHMVLLFRGAAKQLSTYIKPLEDAERVFTILALETITGRLNSTGGGLKYHVNLQNITKQKDAKRPIKIRSMFVPDGDVFTILDASQIELRVLAYLSQDPVMLDIFAAGGDIHADTAKALNIDRIDAKRFNFARLYGASADVIADNIGTKDVASIEKLSKLWVERYPNADAWAQEQMYQGWERGWVQSMYGRRIPIPFEQGRKHADNCSINYPIQCTAGEIFKRVMLECKSLLNDMRLQVHDELIFDGKVELPKGLEELSPIHIPFDVEIRNSWDSTS